MLVYIVIGILIVTVIVLSVKIHLLQKSADELADSLKERLETDTNTLLTVSHRDRHIRRLTGEINVQLKKLRAQQLKFEQGDAELKTAVTNISHDLRTPLTAICGYLELLENEEKTPEVSRYLEIIGGRIESMKKLTEELFRYSVVSAVRELMPEEVDLKKFLEDTLVSFYGNFSEKGIEPVIEMPENAVVRKLDKDALSRVLSNVISNASKYSDGDFYVTLHENGTVIFKNTARNLDPILTGRLFDRFFTVEANRDSTGLGLSIARHFVQLMGGSITGEYVDDKLVITLEFPE